MLTRMSYEIAPGTGSQSKTTSSTLVSALWAGYASPTVTGSGPTV